MYWPQPAHSHQQHSPTRAQLEGCHSEPQLKECHMLKPYPELNSRDMFQATTQGTPTSRPLRYSRSLVDHAYYSKHNTNLLQQNRLALLMRRQELPVFMNAWRGSRTAKRKHAFDAHACSYRLARHSSLPGATRSSSHWFSNYCLVAPNLPPSDTLVQWVVLVIPL